MKKQYEKPMIYVEDFTMCQNIAAGCNKTEGANQYQGACHFEDINGYGDILFNSLVSSCEVVIDLNDCQDGSNSYGGYFFS